MGTTEFFDQYSSTAPSAMPLPYRLLRRWEVSRIEVAAQLVSPGESMLDIGCGTGSLLALTAVKFRTSVGIDVSSIGLARAAELARRGARGAPRWQQLNANENLPFQDEAFSAVTCVSVLQYIVEPESLLKEVFRVLRPGGEFVVQVPNVAFLPQRLRLLVGLPIRTSYHPHGIDGGNLHYFTVVTLKRLVRVVGFDIQRVTGSGILRELRVWWVSLLCGDIILLARKPGRGGQTESQI